MLVININFQTFGDMFRLIEPSAGEIQNIVLLHSVSAHIMGSYTVYKIILTLKIIY